MKERMVTLLGEIYIECTVGEDCDRATEILSIDNIEALLNYDGSKETPVHLSMEEIKQIVSTPTGMRKSKQEYLEALIDKQDAADRSEAEQERAGDLLWGLGGTFI